MLFGGGLTMLVTIGLMAYCVFDIISTDESRIQNLPKMAWLIIVIILPLIGGLAWLLLGRPSGADWRPGATTGRPAPQPPMLGLPERPPVSSEDHAAKREETLKRYYEEREQELRRREEDLRRREDELRRRETDEGTG